MPNKESWEMNKIRGETHSLPKKKKKVFILTSTEVGFLYKAFYEE